MSVRRLLPVALTLAGLLLVPASAHAAMTSTLVGSSATITGDAAAEVLLIDDSGGLLRHNRSGDPGFNSAFDFETGTAGDQTLAASTLSTVSVSLAAGPNTLTVKDNSAVAHTWTVGSSTLVTPLATISYDASLSGITLQGGGGVDTFALLATAAVTPITIESGAGADAVNIGSAAGTLAPIAGNVRISGAASGDVVSLNDTVGTAGVTYSFDQEPGRTTLTRSGTGAGVVSWDASVGSVSISAGVSGDAVHLVAPPATATVINLSLGRGVDTFKPSGVTHLGGGTINGGDGYDTFDLSAQTNGLTIDLASGTAGAFGAAASIEHLVGSPGDDVLRGTNGGETISGNDGADTISGLGGDDVLYAASEWTGESAANSLDGGDGADSLEGSGGADTLTGGDGTDSLDGDGGNDTSTGGAGDDTIFGLDSNEVITGGDGIDTLDASRHTGAMRVSLDGVANDGLATKQANVARDVERALGGSGNDTFIGSAAKNTFTGGRGNDTFHSLAKVDGADVFDGGPGIDTMSYAKRATAVTVILDARANDGARNERDKVIAENVAGGRGNDVLTGDRSKNRLVGGAGNDLLTGGRAADILDGGLGIDRAVRDRLDRLIRIP